MKTKLLVLIGIIVVIGLALAIWKRPAKPATEETTPPKPTLKEQIPQTVKTERIEEQAADAMPTVAVPPSPFADPTPRIQDIDPSMPLVDSPLAKRWMELEGYTREEILAAQELLRKDGYSEPEIEDPGNVRRVLPPRHVSSVVPTGLTIPEQAMEGEPIAFVLEGRVPDPSFTFTRFVFQQQGPVISIRANGHSDGAVVAAHEGENAPIALPGEIPGLPAGEYRIEIVEMGPHGIFPLTVAPAETR